MHRYCIATSLFAMGALASLYLSAAGVVGAGSAPAWLLEQRTTQQLEREQPARLTPVQVGAARLASQLFNGRQVHVDSGDPLGDLQRRDMFQCVEPTRQSFSQFVNLFGRKFHDHTEQLERQGLFMTTLKRTIMLNRIVQNEILNETNYQLGKRAIGNYHFIAPLGAQNVAPWYADITDCELGLIKNYVFNIFYLIDTNQLAEAYKVAVHNSEHLPLLNATGFEQLANILLVRLYDRFVGDQMMDQLFRWPQYFKALAGFAYNRRQAAQENYMSRLRLIAFAYPAYYKDLKYNPLALNRTGDNWEMNDAYDQFNKFHKRQYADLREKNKRLQIFRQRWTLTSQLYDTDRWWPADWRRTDIQLEPEWNWTPVNSSNPEPQSEQLLQEEMWLQALNTYAERRLRSKRTQFSDLTDAEFVAYLNNDYSLLEPSSAKYLAQNFGQVRQLDEALRSELANELELRRMTYHRYDDFVKCKEWKKIDPNQLTLERQVIEELIADVGLPVGPTSVDDIAEEEYFDKFTKLGRFFAKSYHTARDSDSADERQRRYEQFKANYGRFKAWHIKEGWAQMDEARVVAMLRLADLSWHEIKVLLFRVCCLTENNLAALSAENATINYMGTQQYLCQPLNSAADQSHQHQFAANGTRNDLSMRPELAALELYYYYSVHFNKHHSQMDLFNRHFAIFKHNVDHIRRHTCTRGLSLYRSLKRKQADTLSTIDVLDPRRAHTDDINLDRFRYFVIPNLKLAEQPPELDDGDGGEGERASLARLQRERVDSAHLSRAGISYRRESLFSGLLNNNGLTTSDDNSTEEWTRVHSGGPARYASRLVAGAQDTSRQALEYKRNSAAKIYDIVADRYNLCLKLARVEESNSNLHKQCHSAGPLAEQTNVWQTDQLSSDESQKLQLTEQCSYYWMGLQFWEAGLIKQDPLSVHLIQSAKC